MYAPRPAPESPCAMTGHDELLGQLLLDEGAITPGVLRDAREEHLRSGRRLGEILLRKGAIDEVQLARALAAQLDLPFVAPPLRPEPRALATVEAGLARRQGVLPLSLTGRRLTVAMGNALDTDALDDLRFQSGCRVEPVVAPASEVAKAVLEAYGGELPELLDSLDRPGDQEREGGLEVLEEEAAAAPIIRIVDHLLSTATDHRASDIHVETTDTGSRVRLRVDGVLATAIELPPGTHHAVISRIKIMADLDISVRRRPQDGGFTVQRRDTELTIRVSTIPTKGGEKAALRLLDPGDAPGDLASLGLSAHDLERLRQLLDRRQGALLAAGPTGSGKTTTLSGAVAELATRKINIVTLEDPVEYRFPGVAQMEIDRKAGVGFPAGLRAILRQDPDVILVGEVRDRETAEIAMSAAVTGHLVLTTIHTVDAPSAIVRLLEMGVPPFLVAGGLSGVVAQTARSAPVFAMRGTPARLSRLQGRLPRPQRRLRGPGRRRRDQDRGDVRGTHHHPAHAGAPQRNALHGPRRDAPSRREDDDAARGGPDHCSHQGRRRALRQLQRDDAARGRRVSHVRPPAPRRLPLRRTGGSRLAVLPGLSAPRRRYDLTGYDSNTRMRVVSASMRFLRGATPIPAPSGTGISPSVIANSGTTMSSFQ